MLKFVTEFFLLPPMGLLRVLCYPFSLVYGFLMFLRNKLFDFHLLRSVEFDVPVISVGNLCMGGTGKTPLVEYLIRLLSHDSKVVTLSRGYGRKTRGFILAGKSDTYGERDIGDESLQYHRKFQNIFVAVDEQRVRGIKNILKQQPETDVILLDDAFQHRYVKPGLSILLTDYYHLFTHDHILPSGSLREFKSGAKRADIIVVTKTHKVFSPILRREIEREIRPRPHQKLFYSYLTYGEAVPFKHTGTNKVLKKRYRVILMITGIANPYPLQEHLIYYCEELTMMDFRDHHRYTKKDVQKIAAEFNSIYAKDKVIFTTEKDAMRLDQPEFSDLLKGLPVFYIPVKVEFHSINDASFDNQVIEYVKKNSGDG